MTAAQTVPPRIRWTRRQCRALMEAGILPAAAFELIDGEIRQKIPQNKPHVRIVIRLTLALVRLFGEDFVRSQAPIALGPHDEPEPDAFVTTRPRREYLTIGTPPAADIRLVVEVSDATLAYDRSENAPLYAAAGIPEYWIVDVNARRLLVHREPTPGGYASLQTLTETDAVSPLAASGVALPVADLLP